MLLEAILQFDPDEAPAWLRDIATPFSSPIVLAGIDDDDCAVLSFGDDLLLVTTDFLNDRPIAQELGVSGWADLGRLTVLSNLSDLCGSGAEPIALMAGVMMPRDAGEADFQSYMLGFVEEAHSHGVPVVGGDSKLGRSRALFAVAVGRGDRQCVFLKNSASPGDDLWVSGPVGSCAAAVAGWELLAADAPWRAWARRAILNPTLPLAKSRTVARTRLANGGIDVSDGLGNDVARLCVASSTGVILDAPSLPILPQTCRVAEYHGLDPWTFAFAIGGDLTFVVSAPPVARDLFVDAGLTRIGVLTSRPDLIVQLADGTQVPMPRGGHRDARDVTFAQESLALVRAAFPPASP